MTKNEIKKAALEKMIDTVIHIQTHTKNGAINYRNNMGNYFCGLADALQLVTGNEYHYSTPDGVEFSIVEIVNGKHKVLWSTK